MYVSDASYYISKEKKKNKGSQMGHTKNKIYKKVSFEYLPSCLFQNAEIDLEL
jgi:hypothetical protein